MAIWFSVGLAYLALLALVLVLNFFLARRNAKRYPSAPPPPPSLYVPLTSEQERDLYIAYRRTAAMQPGGLIVSRRA